MALRKGAAEIVLRTRTFVRLLGACVSYSLRTYRGRRKAVSTDDKGVK
jgi:hypothetical protein